MSKATELLHSAGEEIASPVRSQGISVSLLILLLLQTGGIVWWGATITANVANLNQTVLFRVDREEQERTRLDEKMNQQINRLEGQITEQRIQMQTLREKLAAAGWKPPRERED